MNTTDDFDIVVKPPFKSKKLHLSGGIKWVSVKDKLPNDEKRFVTFAQWHQLERYPPIIIISYTGTYENVKKWRKFDLENNYTHWHYSPTTPKQ